MGRYARPHGTCTAQVERGACASAKAQPSVEEAPSINPGGLHKNSLPLPVKDNMENVKSESTEARHDGQDSADLYNLVSTLSAEKLTKTADEVSSLLEKDGSGGKERTVALLQLLRAAALLARLGDRKRTP